MDQIVYGDGRQAGFGFGGFGQGSGGRFGRVSEGSDGGPPGASITDDAQDGRDWLEPLPA